MTTSDHGAFHWGGADPVEQASRLTAAWHAESRTLAGRALEARRRVGDTRLGERTRERLRRVADATEHNLGVLHDLMSPVHDLASRTRSTGHAPNATRTATERGRGFSAIALPYLFRDWIWGLEEVRVIREPVVDVLRGSRHPARGLVLGGGAMRLPWELSLALPTHEITVVERNPLFCLAIDRMRRGAVLDLWEVAQVPRDLQSVATPHRLQWPEPTGPAQPMTIVMGDVREWAPDHPVDWLLTCFVLDVAGADALASIARWTSWLRPGGCWINVGPLGFQQSWRPDAYTLDEVLERLPSLHLVTTRVEACDWPHVSSPYEARLQRFRGAFMVSTRVVIA